MCPRWPVAFLKTKQLVLCMSEIQRLHAPEAGAEHASALSKYSSAASLPLELTLLPHSGLFTTVILYAENPKSRLYPPKNSMI